MSPSPLRAAAVAATESWRGAPIQLIPVRALGPFSTTADGACPVAFGTDRRGFVKPRPDAARNLTVAREKIASDLAHELDLPVAPVVIREPEPADGWNHHSAMSLSCLVSGRHWSGGGQAHLDAVKETLEGLRVFWTWIGDIDHNGHGENLLYQVLDGVVDVLAIDHSYSLGHGHAGDPLTIPACSGYGTLTMPACLEARQRTVTQIKALDWPTVENTVRRLAPILTNSEQEPILQLLQARRDQLDRLVGA